MNLINFASKDDGPAINPISPSREMGAYEAMWLEDKASFKTIADRFKADPTALPSDFVEPARIAEAIEEARRILNKRGVSRFGVRVHHAGDYPQKLRDARHPVELLYYQGAWELTETRCIAIVGSRKASEEGVIRARKIAREAVQRNFTVVSGLAEGIDTAAHSEALASPEGRTIAVIGTPIGEFYPRQNRILQNRIARDFLVISQVPIVRYSRQGPAINRLFFPERNATMSALTEGTIIVEAGETSGTLTQARAALHQGRKLFILDSCFQRKDLTWPQRFAEMGAIRVRTSDDIWGALG
ncbi:MULTISPECIES: DNA-processing protein DprA [unclassified Mesorhizobium]|uniref:DNA-processing protein DprA n=1 Tax=unclassified Mesorhizobium TaxID=325217 RepID=UPI00241728D2|nr:MULTISPECIES: DNA-processing protein DprA [unclassified Mesorhizobium]MDG4903526.1 DNA-protecting protein DprA [Mesorhizobium sp. WSM4962]MDG4921424.1 DNA-protecting protein DprA [Mesorhizobium sp. WSM4989]